MHYHAEVWIPSDANPEKAVAAAMSPYDENVGGANTFWDWYQIGGRWKGRHVPGYDPNNDPTHIVVCDLCHGTGTRPDAARFGPEWLETTKGCNGCGGAGKHVDWPTQWKAHPQDVLPVGDVPDDLTSHTLVLPAKVLHAEEWHPKSSGTDKAWQSTVYASQTVQQALREEGITTGFLVTVDYHS